MFLVSLGAPRRPAAGATRATCGMHGGDDRASAVPSSSSPGSLSRRLKWELYRREGFQPAKKLADSLTAAWVWPCFGSELDPTSPYKSQTEDVEQRPKFPLLLVIVGGVAASTSGSRGGVG